MLLRKLKVNQLMIHIKQNAEIIRELTSKTNYQAAAQATEPEPTE